MKLYYAPGACSLASHIIAKEIGIDFSIEKVDLGTHKTEHGENYYDVNPKGYVPALVINDSQKITEGAVVLQYLADLAPEKNLIPAAGTFERYKTQEWLTFIGTEIHKGFAPLWNSSITEDMRKVVLERLMRRLEYVESYLKNNDYLVANSFSIADAYLFVILNWSKMLNVDLTAYPKVKEYVARIMERPTVLSAMKAEGLF